LYSYSFEPHFNWNSPYATQPQILAYLKYIADKYELRQHLRLGTEVVESRWIEDRQVWQMQLGHGELLEGEVLVNAMGALVKPSQPAFKGLEHFQGPVFHSARWRHDVDLAGKRVALIGTGASAIQIAPEVAALAQHLRIFQRSAPWVMPRNDQAYGPVTRWLYRRLPGLLRLNRWRIYIVNELITLGFLGSAFVRRLMVRAGLHHMLQQLDDPDLIARAVPDHPPGCKRVLVSDTWYPTLAKPHVSLVSRGIDRITRQGIVTADGKLHEVDVIIFGTGFVVTDFSAITRIQGRHGRDLGRQWMQAARTHLGLATHGFPNLFFLLGPGTGLGSNSMVFMLEAQANYIAQAVGHIAREEAVLDLKEDVQAASYADLQRRMKRTVWASGCTSWYQTPSGRIDTLWPDFSFNYWRRTRHFDPSAYDVRPLSRRQPDQAAAVSVSASSAASS
jgi:cation diffusion facilitator CzcD-associated flavoprotein CzcO